MEVKAKYVVTLTTAEREPLRDLAQKGRVSVQQMRHAQVVLILDFGSDF